MNVIQVGVLGVAGALLAIQFKSQKPEYGIYICVALGVFIFFGIIGYLRVIVDAIETIAGYISLEQGYITTLLKMFGVTYVAEFSAGLCKDAGYGALASQIEIFGKLSILVMGLPVFMTLLQTMQEFLS